MASPQRSSLMDAILDVGGLAARCLADPPRYSAQVGDYEVWIAWALVPDDASCRRLDYAEEQVW